jgi:hypothetical protein
MSADYLAPLPPNGPAWLARATASGLCAAARLNVAGLILAVVNFHLAVRTAPAGIVYPVLGAASLLGATQLYLLVRIEIDRRLFDALAMTPDADDLAALDYALTILGWARRQRNDRSLSSRSCGAIRFLQSAGALAGLQLLTVWLLILLG